jgi:outer membrane protein OmpA-like peptidoglycan-associated protein
VKVVQKISLLLCVVALAGCGMMAPEPNAPEPNKYVVFFPPAATSLTPEAREIAVRAAKHAKEMNPAYVQLAGYIGNGPTARTDRGLTERRYAAVEEVLTAEGLDPKVFLRVPLVDETPLPATAVRRVEIYLVGR